MTNRRRDAEAARPGWGDPISEHLPGALRLAAVLTGSTAEATRLAVAAQIGRGRRAASDDYPELALRRSVARVFTGRKSDFGAAAAGTGMLAHYDLLPKDARVVVALRLVERLTTAEIATTVDRPAGQVARLLERALDDLRPAAEADIALALATRSDLAPEPESVLGEPAVGRPVDRRRRLRVTAVGVAAVVVTALGIVAPTVIAPRLPVAARPVAHWGTVVGTARASGWHVTARTIVANQELALITRGRPAAGEAPEKSSCSVLVADGARLSDYPDRRGQVSVNGHRGYLLGTSEAPDARVAWVYSGAGEAGSVAEIDCTQLAGARDADVVAAAEKVRFKAGPLPLPYTLDRSPEHFSPGWVVTGADGSVDATYTSTEARWSFVTVTVSMDHSTASIREAQTTRTRISGRTAFVSQDRDDTGLPQICLMDDRGRVCVKAYWTAGDWTTRYQMNDDIGAVMMATAERLRLASNLDDPSTWFDAEDVLR